VPRDSRSPFGHRDFALYFSAQVIEAFALTMATVAIGWQVYSVDENPLHLALVALAEFLPLPLLALPAGHLADRLPRRRLWTSMLALNTVVLGALLVVTQSGADQVWPFFALAFLQGTGSAIGAPASRALLPSLVPRDLLLKALAQRSIGFQLTVVAGPAAGGLLFAIDDVLVYAVGAGLSLVAVGCAFLVRKGREPASDGGAAELDDVLAGVRLIRRTRVLFGAISLDLFAVLLGGAVALLPIFAKDVLEVGPTGLGLLRAATPAGAFLAALVLARYPVRRRAGPTLFLVVAGFGASIVVFGLSRQMWLSLIALAASGAFDLVSMVLRSTIVPLVTPDELRGRVNAVEMVFISASNELGAFESGVAAALIGAVPAVVVGGIATIAVAAIWWRLFPELGRMDRIDELRPVAIEPAEAFP
jgi:Transmembrane secretion effector